MFDIDKYSFISLLPSLLIVLAMIVMFAVGIPLLRKVIAKDAAKAEQQKNKLTSHYKE